MNSKKVDVIQRQQIILLLLALDGKVLSKRLSHRLNVSYDIILNDMIDLEKNGLLKRIESGAMILEESSETNDK
tara:strand:+ start:2502 stop:2723 length:222 start_codon:yes stop_codon:yes gene_type:complete